MTATTSWALQYVLRDVDVDATVMWLPHDLVPVWELWIPPVVARGIVAFLMATAGIGSATQAIVVELPAGTVGQVDGQPAWTYGAKRIWIVPLEERLDLLVRHHPNAPNAPSAMPTPKQGQFAMPSPLPPPVPKYQYRELSVALACPHCGASATRYRIITGGLVCPACARSFTP